MANRRRQTPAERHAERDRIMAALDRGAERHRAEQAAEETAEQARVQTLLARRREVRDRRTDREVRDRRPGS